MDVYRVLFCAYLCERGLNRTLVKLLSMSPSRKTQVTHDDIFQMFKINIKPKVANNALTQWSLNVLPHSR